MALLSGRGCKLRVSTIAVLAIVAALSDSVLAQDDFFGTIAVDLDDSSRRDSPYSLYGWVTEKVGSIQSN